MRRATTLLTNMRRIIKLYDSMLKPVCEHYDLTLMEAAIISFLYNNPGKDTAADIVELRMLAKSNVSQAVESLIQKSLLYRTQDTKDRRKIHLSLAEKTKPITQEIERVRERFRERVFQGFSEEEENLMVQFNKRIAENIKLEGERRENR